MPGLAALLRAGSFEVIMKLVSKLFICVCIGAILGIIITVLEFAIYGRLL